MNELKPCPFCGGGQVRQSPERDSSIVCQACDVVVSLLVQPYGRGWQQGTRDVWNSRSETVTRITPKVKPLVWNERHQTNTALGPLCITINAQGDAYHCVDVLRYDYIVTAAPTIDEAKASAQAWYEAKIKECLE